MINARVLAGLCLLAWAALGDEDVPAVHSGTGLVQQGKQSSRLVDVLEDSLAGVAKSMAGGSEQKVDGLANGAGGPGAGAAQEPQVSVKKCVAEFVAMALFVFFGCGSAMSVAREPGWLLQVSLSFGLAITVLAYAIGHYSGGQINCAVTFGLVLAGALPIVQGLCNVVAQMLGAVAGAAVLKMAYPSDKDLTGGLGTNAVSEGWSKVGALIVEAVGTFLLMYVVLETAVNPAGKANAALAPLAIGLAVFLAHSVMIPIDGCSINPTRSFGPALVQAVAGGGSESFKDMWIFWAGPLAGAAAAAGLYTAMVSL